ncbi:Helix-loop-helix DNA-binding domain superfamily [Arabidopsis suecica]|uniref:Helix-loop-helix DNA-binding domain superfamily n=1 Tax=Arabidopsis suecica TaxID=45249 RepID=A0A8T1Y543_ARASU|nr:Helix-loop-helix DNA-binding domain superfamily [Arabidopsis suecica]
MMHLILSCSYLISMDGYYNIETSEEPSSSSSSGSLARSLFHEYRQSVIPLQNGHVPSMAFMNNLPYVEIRPQEIQRLAFNDAQRLFYQMKIEASLREWFPEDFNRKSSPVNSDYLRPPHHPSSSSSSLSPNNVSEYSSLLSPLIPKPSTTTEPVNVPVLPPLAPINMIHLQQQEPLFRNREREEEAMTQAILAVLTGPSSPPSTSSSPQRKGRATAFNRYYSMISGKAPLTSVRKQSMMKRAISFYNRLNIYQRERFQNATTHGEGSGGSGGGGRYTSGPSATQLHHMISERRRREKLNESFQALRSLLPPGTKKDKASVLSIAREQLSSLQGEISKLLERNRKLEAKLAGERDIKNDLLPNERFNVHISHISESTSRERVLDLRVVLRGDSIRVDDLMIRLLEFLKQINNVSLVSIEARTLARDTSVVLVSLRLKIEGEWDESAFQEAVRRVVADLAH